MIAEKMPSGEYRAIRAVNWSTAKAMIYSRDRRTRKPILSPLHYRAAVEGVVPDTPTLAYGRAVHCAVLEPHAFEQRFATYRASKTTGEGARKAWEAFQETERCGLNRPILAADKYDGALEIGRIMRDRIAGHPKARELLAQGTPEVVRRWTDRETGILCKGRIDWISAPYVMLDVKTDGRTLDELAFSSHAEHLLYFHQFAFYRRGQAAFLGKSPDVITFYVIAIESDHPHAIAVREVSPGSLDSADEEVGEVLRKIKECRDAEARGELNPWPGPYPETGEMSRPGWAIPEIEGGFEIIEGGQS